MTTSPIKTALASYGMSGQLFHAPFLNAHSSYDFAYVLERSKKKCNDHYPSVISLDTWEQILASDAELIIINTPTYLHYPMAKEALLAGKNVVVEKPVCSSVKETEELITLAKQQHLVLNVYHNMRLEGEVKTAKELIDQGTLGDIIGFEAYFDRYRPDLGPKVWKESPHAGAGLVYDIGSHLIDQVLQFFGEPKNITSAIKIERPVASVPDCFDIQFHYKNFTANIGAGMLIQNPRPKLKITGTKGTYTYNNFDPQESQLKQGMSPIDENFGIDLPENYGTFEKVDGSVQRIPTHKGGYMEYYDNLANVLLGNTSEVLVKNQDAQKVVEIIETLYTQNHFQVNGEKLV
jgi:predicted dehydrogenase